MTKQGVGETVPSRKTSDISYKWDISTPRGDSGLGMIIALLQVV